MWCNISIYTMLYCNNATWCKSVVLI